MTAVFPFFNSHSVQKVQQVHTAASPGVAHFLLAEFLLGKILGIERRKTCTSHLIAEPPLVATQQILLAAPLRCPRGDSPLGCRGEGEAEPKNWRSSSS